MWFDSKRIPTDPRNIPQASPKTTQMIQEFLHKQVVIRVWGYVPDSRGLLENAEFDFKPGTCSESQAIRRVKTEYWEDPRIKVS